MCFHIWDLVMYCTGSFIKFVVCNTPTIEKNASFVPGLIAEKVMFIQGNI